MSDQNVREIHLGGKQLVFLFMTSVVLGVAVFLLGISVGRGVRDASVDSVGSPGVGSADDLGPVEMPPPTTTTPEDFGYHEQLQGQSRPPVDAPPDMTPQATVSPSLASDGGGAPTDPAPAPPAVATSSPDSSEQQAARPDTPGDASGDAGWFVQVNAFRSRANADRQMAELRGKGYTTTSVFADPGGTLFRVRLGPFVDRGEADRAAQRLLRQEGIRSSVQH